MAIEWVAMPTKQYTVELNKLSHSRKVKYIVMGSRKDDPYCAYLDR